MGRRESIKNRQYTDEFKVEAVRLGESIGVNQAAKRLGIPDSSLWNWIRLKRVGKLKVGDNAQRRMAGDPPHFRRVPRRYSSESQKRRSTARARA